jgi:glycosyltransferase involved in cell wall biosynthesis
MRILLVHPYSWPEVRRGGERYLADLAWYLDQAGHAVTVVTGTEGPRTIERESGAELVRLHRRLPRHLEARGMSSEEAFGATAYPYLLRHRADAVFALTPTAALAARAAGHRTVYSILGHPTPEQLSDRPWLRRTFKLAVRAARTTAALSAASARGALETFGRAPIVLSPGVRLAGFPVREEAPEPSSPWKILFPAHAEDRRKGLDVLLTAFGLLAARHPTARLQIGGPGDPGWALSTLSPDARALIEGRIDVLGAGSLDELPARYRAASMTVLPSRDEAFGLVLVESLASGTPVVCTASGGPPEIVDQPGIGRVAESDDPLSLAAAIEAVGGLLAEPGLAARCADHARRWGWLERIGPEHERVLANAAARRPPR